VSWVPVIGNTLQACESWFLFMGGGAGSKVIFGRRSTKGFSHSGW